MDRDFEETLEMLREAHREAIPEPHFAAVRARVLAQLAAERRPWWRGTWAFGLAASAMAALLLVGLTVGRTPWSVRVPLDPRFVQLNQPRVSPERQTRASAADQGIRPTNSVTRRKRLPHKMAAAYRVIGPPDPRPLMVKLITNDPDVVIYWFTGE
jgi:hypothetical protein